MRKQIIKAGLRYGLLGAAASILLFCVLYWLGDNPLMQGYYFGFIILPLFMYFALREFRDSRNGGILHFWQGVGVGLMLLVAIILVPALFQAFFLAVLDKGLFERHVQETVQLFMEEKENLVEIYGQQGYEEQLLRIKNTSIFGVVINGVIKLLIVWLFVTGLFSIIFRRLPT